MKMAGCFQPAAVFRFLIIGFLGALAVRFLLIL